MNSDLASTYSQVLDKMAGEVDISPTNYDAAVQHYAAVGNWLDCGTYDGCRYPPSIYPQGSFRLGTVVRPVREGKESDYDIDLVCELQGIKESFLPQDVKSMVGDRLKESERYRSMLDREGRRCWTLNYADENGIGFHLDVLPSLPEDDQTIDFCMASGVNHALARQAITITERNGNRDYSWLSSNPNGYANWFDIINRPAFDKIAAVQKLLLLQENRAIFQKVEEVPDQLVRTPLQRAIQILKHHRDLRFAGHEFQDSKPISMIITTLSARLYQQEADTFSALKGIVDGLDVHSRLLQPGGKLDEHIAGLGLISRRPDGTWYIANPVNPDENFADRWHDDNHRKAKAFFQWLTWVRSDLVDILDQGDLGRIIKSMEAIFGGQLLQKAAQGTYAMPAVIVAGDRSIEPLRIGDRNPSKPWGRLV